MNARKEIDQLLKQLEQQPDDTRLAIRIADLMVKAGDHKSANDLYERAAGVYAKQGFMLKAIALAKQVLERDPTRLRLRQTVAQQYEKLALTTEALAQYQLLLSDQEASGDLDGAAMTAAALKRLAR